MTPYETLSRLIFEVADFPAEEVKPELDLYADIGLDSLDMVELALAIEDAFSFEIGDDECEAMKTVKDALALVEAKSAVRAA